MSDAPREAESVTCPPEFDAADVAYARTLVPDGSFVTEMVTVVGWLQPDGEYSWRRYCAMSTERLSSTLGLLAMAQHELMMTNTNLRAIIEQQDDDE